jgi:hypothetical protein
MAVHVMRIASAILAPAPSHARRCNLALEYDVGDTLLPTLCGASKLICNIGHEVGLTVTMDILIDIDGSNHPSLWIRIVVRNTKRMTVIGDPTIGTFIAILVGVIELQS